MTDELKAAAEEYANQFPDGHLHLATDDDVKDWLAKAFIAGAEWAMKNKPRDNAETIARLKAEVERRMSIEQEAVLRKEQARLKDMVENANTKCAKALEHIDKVHHAIANAQEWYLVDPEDDEQMDAVKQVGNWIERAFDDLKEARAALEGKDG